MPKLSVFNMVSIDGYIADADGDMSWAHAHDPEWLAFVSGNAGSGGRMLFGRVTYEMMMAFWPTAMAAEQLPVVAERMNSLPKVVFSRTLDAATWNNTVLVTGDIVDRVRAMKDEPGMDMVILGSGSIVAQMTAAGLVDTYQIVVIPIVVGAGKTMFAGVAGKPRLTLTGTRRFENGNVLLDYAAG